MKCFLWWLHNYKEEARENFILLQDENEFPKTRFLQYCADCGRIKIITVKGTW